ncbi:hypothetical protein DAPPUDRAFT_320304 [Daphnia pulex]|uniref:MULE transposase domain-containing protein n=1 Tax=Daphnia pulex TaxID=6669 RepID=E9GPH7_DAPPU|nr:hypothetical protein DAPPUDRAFT_320304 [Daphnia pulex]|eukprot:EFX78674.1 hypothetical protein DAPPUDRAFT_320304 [Daphnia pulex]
MASDAYLKCWNAILVFFTCIEPVCQGKQKEAFHFKCNPCSNVEEFVHLGIGNGRDIDQPVASSSSVADDVDQLPASTSRGRGRPRAVMADDVDQLPASTSRGRGRPRAVLADDVDQPPASISRGRGRPRAVLADDVDQLPASTSRGRGRPRAVLAHDVDQPPASLSRGRGRGRNVETPQTPPDSMPAIDQPASYSSRGHGSHTVPPVTTIASLTVNIVLPVSASSPMEDLPLELPIAMNVTCPQDLISPIIAGITYQLRVVETECTYARHLIFATDRQLELLRNAKRWYGDATFDTQVPLVFVLMARKRACDYRVVFTHILDLLMVPPVEEFVMDFEAAVCKFVKA